MIKNIPTYRVVNGELVRVPGDKRDPGRRYRLICSDGGTYRQEFTDEEEMQRDQEEAQWAADAPKREDERKKREAEYENFKRTLVYEDRYVAFLDILGWSSVIEESIGDHELTQGLGVSLNYIQMRERINRVIKVPQDMQITHFSDCIAISTNAARHITFSMLLETVRDIAQNFLRMGFLFRGGISKGKLLHKGNMIYGPALIRAYELECKEAITPRILIDDGIVDKSVTGVAVRNKNGDLLGYTKLWALDSDDKVMADYLRPFMDMPDTQTPELVVRSVLEPAYTTINHGLNTHQGNEKILRKYRWLTNYYNMVCDDYPYVDLTKFIDVEFNYD